MKMELLESISWIVAGFAPTLLSLEIGYRFGIKRKMKSPPTSPKIVQK